MNMPPPLPDILRRALAYGAEALPPYSCASSKHDFTQPQLFACLVFKHYRRRTYREAVEDLALSPAVLALLGLKKVPHYSTLSKFASRALSAAAFQQALTCILRDVRPAQEVACMDSSAWASRPPAATTACAGARATRPWASSRSRRWS